MSSAARARNPVLDETRVDATRPPFDGLSRSVVDTALQRVIASTTFRRSERHRLFLRHIVGEMLDERQAELKEVVIGVEVFGRRLASYDPRTDPIVRVEAGRVRDKLARCEATGTPTIPSQCRARSAAVCPQDRNASVHSGRRAKSARRPTCRSAGRHRQCSCRKISSAS